MKRFNILNIKKEKGFAMLFAVLISSMLITIGVSIFNISIKELMISASIRDSQAAYYAADSATECFFYWNYLTEEFNYCDSEPCDNDFNIKCNGIVSDISFVDRGNPNIFKSTGFFKYSSSTNGIDPEANIVITKTSSASGIEVIADFFGYNTGVSGRRVERSYRRTI